MEYKRVSIADENDNVIGSEDYFVALEKGLLRQIARVFVFDTDGKLLVQKRSKNIRLPLLLDQSVGGHVDEGETYLQAAIREMEEEIGLVGIDLIEIATSYRTNIFNGIYKAVVPVDTPIIFDEYEIEKVCWMTPEEIDRRMKETPAEFTDGFIDIWQCFHDKLVA